MKHSPKKMFVGFNWVNWGLFMSNYFIIKIHQTHFESTWQILVLLTPQVFLTPPKAFWLTAVHHSLLCNCFSAGPDCKLSCQKWTGSKATVFKVFFGWVCGKLEAGTLNDHCVCVCVCVCVRERERESVLVYVWTSLWSKTVKPASSGFFQKLSYDYHRY